MLPRFIRERARAIALVLNGLLCLAMTVSCLVYFNSRPQPAPQTSVGSITIHLAQLDHALRFEHLQQAGLFKHIRCRHCDFTRSRTQTHVSETDFADLGLMGRLYLGKGREVLYLHFHGIDIAAGTRRVEQAIEALRKQFPGREEAIQWLEPYRPEPLPDAGAGRASLR